MNVFFIGQVVAFVVGATLAMHVFYAAELMQRAPHYVKAVLMPLAVSSGVTLMWAAVWGNFVVGGIAALGCAFSAVAIMMAAWGNGNYLSRTFQQAHDLRAMTNKQIYDLMAATDGLVTESGFVELLAQEARRKNEKVQ